MATDSECDAGWDGDMSNTTYHAPPSAVRGAEIEDDDECVVVPKGTRFKKSAVHDYFAKAVTRMDKDRWQCLLCGELCLAISAGASRKLQHILGLDAAFKPNKKRCWVKPSMKDTAKEAVELLTLELSSNKKTLRKESRVKKQGGRLEKKRSRSFKKVDEANPSKATNMRGFLMGITKSDVDNLWARFVYAEGIKVAKIGSGFLKEAIAKTLAYGPSYTLPNRARMSGLCLFCFLLSLSD